LLGAAVIAAYLLSYATAQNTGVRVELKNAQGESVGTATLLKSGKGVRIKLDLKNLLASGYRKFLLYHSSELHFMPHASAIALQKNHSVPFSSSFSFSLSPNAIPAPIALLPVMFTSVPDSPSQYSA
jgi:hypothetical protein